MYYLFDLNDNKIINFAFSSVSSCIMFANLHEIKQKHGQYTIKKATQHGLIIVDWQ